METCENCKEEKDSTEIHNYVVKYNSWEAFNCCSKECAKEKAISELGIDEDDIESIAGGA